MRRRDILRAGLAASTAAIPGCQLSLSNGGAEKERASEELATESTPSGPGPNIEILSASDTTVWSSTEVIARVTHPDDAAIRNVSLTYAISEDKTKTTTLTPVNELTHRASIEEIAQTGTLHFVITAWDTNGLGARATGSLNVSPLFGETERFVYIRYGRGKFPDLDSGEKFAFDLAAGELIQEGTETGVKKILSRVTEAGSDTAIPALAGKFSGLVFDFAGHAQLAGIPTSVDVETFGYQDQDQTLKDNQTVPYGADVFPAIRLFQGLRNVANVGLRVVRGFDPEVYQTTDHLPEYIQNVPPVGDISLLVPKQPIPFEFRDNPPDAQRQYHLVGTLYQLDGDSVASSSTTVIVSGTQLAGADTESDIRLGILMNISGQFGRFGSHLADAAKLPAELVNRSDSSLTADYQTVDAGGTRAEAVSAANTLVEDDYPAIVGPSGGHRTRNLTREVFGPHEVVGVSPVFTGPLPGVNDHDYLFRTAPTTALDGAARAYVAATYLDATSAATIYNTQPAHHTEAESGGFATTFENRYGGDVYRQVPYDQKTDNPDDKLDAALSGDPDLLYIAAYGRSVRTLLRRFYASYDSSQYDLLGEGVAGANSLPQDVGDLSNITGVYAVKETARGEGVRRQYQTVYGRDPSQSELKAYDASALVILATAAAGIPRGKALRDQIRTVSNPGGQRVTPDTLIEGIQLAADGRDIQYVGASGPLILDSSGAIAAHRYRIWKFGPQREYEHTESFFFER